MWDLFANFWSKDDSNGAEGWLQEGGKDSSYTCAGVNVYGGFTNFGRGAKVTKKFDLPPHYRIKVKLMYWKFASWDNEIGFVDIDT
jgi:hypothetical protein